MNMLNPALMSADDRHHEVASILALGITRLNQKQHADKHRENDSNSLDLNGFPGVHVVSKDDN